MQGPHIIMRRRRSRGNIEDLRHQAKTVLVGVAILTSSQPAPIISFPFFSRSLYKFGTCSPHSLPTLIEPTNTSKHSCQLSVNQIIKFILYQKFLINSCHSRSFQYNRSCSLVHSLNILNPYAKLTCSFITSIIFLLLSPPALTYILYNNHPLGY